jgi:penicillin-binding protein 1A
MGLGETGGHNAAPVFRDFMRAAIGGQPAVPFRVPPGVRMVRVDLKSGRPVNDGGIMEAFKVGTEPGSGYIARGDTSDGVTDGTQEEDPNAPAQQGQSSGAWGLY